jgi:hypothetical protein
MFEWFFEMPVWLYLGIGMSVAFAFTAFMARKEIKRWYATPGDPNYWEKMRVSGPECPESE